MDNECLFDKKETEPLPTGIYTGEFISANYKKSKAGNIYLLCCVKIIQGFYQGRIVFDYFHVFSDKPKFMAEQREKLSKIGILIGLPRGSTPDKLIGKPFMVEIGQIPKWKHSEGGIVSTCKKGDEIENKSVDLVNKVFKYSKTRGGHE